MTVFYPPITSAFGQNIIANAGSKLFFFKTGTTTPKETFADAAETVPNTDPVVADSTGRFGPIFITGAYDVELTDADGVQVWKVLDLTSSGIAGGVVFLGGFDSSTNAGNYPASGAKGDLFVVTTGFTLNPASGSHILSTRDFIIANIDGATGVDVDWDIIRGVNTPRLEDVSIRPYDINRPYQIGNYAVASDFKIYRALVAQTGNNPAGGGDPTNWLPIADLLNILTSTDITRGLTAAQGKVLKDLIDNPVKATVTDKGVKFLFKRIILSNDPVDTDHDIEFSAGNFNFNDGSGSAVSLTITKQLDATWVSGNDVGGLADPLTIAINTTYHCFALSNADGSSVDTGFDTDINAVNLLADTNVIAAGLTEASYQGRIFTNGSANIILFTQTGRYFYLITEILLFTGSVVNSEQTIPSTGGAGPIGGDTLALLNVETFKNSGVILWRIRVYPTSGNDDLVTSVNAQVGAQRGAGFAAPGNSAFEVATDTSGKINIKGSTTLATITTVGLRGWYDNKLES